MEKNFRLLFALLNLSIFSYVNAQFGFDCGSMSPTSGMTSTVAQSSTPPFSISANPQTINMGDNVEVIIQATSSNYITAYILEVRQGLNEAIYGGWFITNTTTAINCDGGNSNALTQTTTNSITYLDVTWASPTSGLPNYIYIFATLVQDGNTFWGPYSALQITVTNTTSGSYNYQGSSGSSDYTGYSSSSVDGVSGSNMDYYPSENANSNDNYQYYYPSSATSAFSYGASLLFPTLSAFFILSKLL